MSGIYIHDGVAQNKGGCLYVVDLSPSQQKVLCSLRETALQQPVTILTGRPGSGMTTVIAWFPYKFEKLPRRNLTRVNLEFLSKSFPGDALEVIRQAICRALWTYDWLTIVNGPDSAVAGSDLIELVAECHAKYEAGTKNIILEMEFSRSLEQFVARTIPGAAIERMVDPTAEDLAHVLSAALGKENTVNIDFSILFESRHKVSPKILADAAAAAIICGKPQPDTDLLLRLFANAHKLTGSCERLALLQSELYHVARAA